MVLSKDKVKGFILGAVTTGLLLSSTAVFAAPVSKQITAVYNSIKLVVNGEQVAPKDSDGNTVEPFIYNGTTYLPVRAVAQALSEPVEWDGANATVYIGKRPDGSVISLTDLKYVNNDTDKALLVNTGRYLNLAGKEYTKAISLDASGTRFVTYNLDSQYKKLTGLFGIGRNDSGSFSNVLIIYGDGKEIYRSPKTQAGSAVNVSVDVTGVNQLKIEFNSDTWGSVFANPQLSN